MKPDLELKSGDILKGLSPSGVAIISGEGTLREKWFKLSDQDKEVMMLALEVAHNELDEITKMLEEMKVLTKVVE